jgi:hypothetical protein
MNKSQKLLLETGKSKGLVSSGSVTVSGTVSSGEGALLPINWCLTKGGARSTTTQGVVAAASRSKRRENKKERKLGPKLNKK